MSVGNVRVRATLVAVGVLVFAASIAAPSWAEAPTKICVPETASKPVLSASAKNECPTKSTTKYKTEALPSPAELETLDKLLPHVKYVESGVGGKPTIQFSGVNVQVVNGEGNTETKNGVGNLVIGYDENFEAHEQTGSHDLILGEEQTFTSYAGIDAGIQNTISGGYASVIGGDVNTASGVADSVTGGRGNTANGLSGASVSGGEDNTSGGFVSSVSGGSFNEAVEQGASISGGTKNKASGLLASILGGELNTASGKQSSIIGGFGDFAPGEDTSASGGAGNEAIGLKSWVGGGAKNKAEGIASSIFGGKALTATESYQAIP